MMFKNIFECLFIYDSFLVARVEKFAVSFSSVAHVPTGSLVNILM